MFEVALLGVEARHVEHDLLIVAVDLLCGLELCFGFGGVVVEAVELAEQKPGLQIVGLQLGDDLVLLDGGLEDVAGLLALAVAERAQVDAAEEHVSFDVVRVLVDLVLRGGDGLADAAQAKVEVGDAVLKDAGVGVGVERQLVLLDGLRGKILTAVAGGLLFIELGKTIVVVSGGVVHGGRGRGCLGL